MVVITSSKWLFTISLTGFTKSLRCVCKAEVCYVCGANWKTCACPQWYEARLVVDAEHVPEQPEPQQLAAHLQPREGQITEVQRVLLNRECIHAFGTRRDLRHLDPVVCEFCGYEGTEYIFRCGRCSLACCGRCSQFYQSW